MTDKNLTEIIVVLDRSGSMSTIQADMIGGFARFVQEQQALPGDCRMSLYRFDTEYEACFENRPLAEVPELPLEPRGGTALLDAVGKTINAVGRRLRSTPEHKRPGGLVFMIITDGEENSSREFKLASVKKMIEHQTKKYNWQFLYLGADVNSFSAASGMGIRAAGQAIFVNSAQGVNDLWSSNSAAIGGYRGAVGQGLASASVNYAAHAVGTVRSATGPSSSAPDEDEDKKDEVTP